jgi:hypothetical protein
MAPRARRGEAAGDDDAREAVRKIVGEAMSEQRQREDEEKDPNKQWLRKMVREEFGSALKGLTDDKGSASSKRKPAGGQGDDEGDDENPSILEAFFGKGS